jgi:hypothetical protein
VIRGTKPDGTSVSETIVGPNGTTVYSTNVYQTITSVYVTGAEAGASTLGYNSHTTLAYPAKLIMQSSTNLAGVNFVVKGVGADNVQISETMTGVAAGTIVTSTNRFRSITSIIPASAVSQVQFGTELALSGIVVHAQGGHF